VSRAEGRSMSVKRRIDSPIASCLDKEAKKLRRTASWSLAEARKIDLKRSLESPASEHEGSRWAAVSQCEALMHLFQLEEESDDVENGDDETDASVDAGFGCAEFVPGRRSGSVGSGLGSESRSGQRSRSDLGPDLGSGASSRRLASSDGSRPSSESESVSVSVGSEVLVDLTSSLKMIQEKLQKSQNQGSSSNMSNTNLRGCGTYPLKRMGVDLGHRRFFQPIAAALPSVRQNCCLVKRPYPVRKSLCDAKEDLKRALRASDIKITDESLSRSVTNLPEAKKAAEINSMNKRLPLTHCD